MKKVNSDGLRNLIRDHWKTLFVGAIIPSVLGLFLAETMLSVQFTSLQPILGGMTFLTVEFLGAWLVDFPLSVVAGCIITKNIGLSEPKYGTMAGAIFFTIFLVLVACVGGGLHQFAPFFDVFGLGNAVLLAVNTAKQEFGFHLGVIIFMFIVFDYFICMLGGLLGFYIAQLIISPENKR